MSTIREIIAEGLQELEGLLTDALGETKTLILPSGAEIPCVPAMEEVGAEVQIGRQVETILASVLVRKTHFVTADNTVISADSDVILADNSTATPRTSGQYRTGGFRGKTYRVLTVSEDPSGAYFKIRMGSAR